MNPQISWQVELDLRPDRIEAFRTLTKEMVEHARTEPGVLIYERFISDDQRTAYVYERYLDSEAAIAHLKSFQEKFDRRFADMVQRRRFLVLGEPSAALRDILDGLGAEFVGRLDGFSTLSSAATRERYGL